VIATGAEQVRLGLGVYNYCRSTPLQRPDQPFPLLRQRPVRRGGSADAPSTPSWLTTPRRMRSQDGNARHRSPPGAWTAPPQGRPLRRPASVGRGHPRRAVVRRGARAVRGVAGAGDRYGRAERVAWRAHTYESAWRGLDWTRRDSIPQQAGGLLRHVDDRLPRGGSNFTGSDTDKDPSDLDPRGQRAASRTTSSRMTCSRRGRASVSSTRGAT